MSINCYSGRLTKAHVIRAFGIRDDPDPAIGSDLDHPGSVWLSDIEKAVVRQRQSDGLSQIGCHTNAVIECLTSETSYLLSRIKNPLTITAGTRLGRYEIRSQLGAG